MSESEVRRCIEGVSMNVGSMRYAEALREAARLAPVEEEELRVKTSTFFLSFVHPILHMKLTVFSSMKKFQHLSCFVFKINL
mmetsp:Transcript_2416/g.3879  ORF Transcript_2416/g.3879 Transcript_2416/m.3879 type:complete len:82 (+) Transcript_2416:83-328(+)